MKRFFIMFATLILCLCICVCTAACSKKNSDSNNNDYTSESGNATTPNYTNKGDSTNRDGKPEIPMEDTFIWQDEYTIERLASDMMLASFPAKEELSGTIEEGQLIPVQCLPTPNPFINGKTFRIKMVDSDFLNGSLNEVLMIYYPATNERTERSVVFANCIGSAPVILVLETSFGSPENFASQISSPFTAKVITTVIASDEDFSRVIKCVDLIPEVEKEYPGSTDMELNPDDKIYYAHVTYDSTEIYSESMIKKIFSEDHGYASDGLDVIAKTYDRFSLNDFIQ